YDVLLTFDAEVNYIWWSKWSWVKVLFFLTRYSALVEAIITIYLQSSTEMTPSSCSTLFSVTGCKRRYNALYGYHAHLVIGWCFQGMFMFGAAAAEAIIMLRTWAIWDRNQFVAYILGITFVGTFIPACFFVHRFLISLQFVPMAELGTLSDGRGCFITQSNHVVTGAYVCLIAFDSVVVALSLYKAYELGYSHLSRSKLLQTLYRDGTLYYIVLLACSVISIAVILAVNLEFVILLVTMQRVLYAVLSSRILLHIRQA
ncbi:hypothetical protein HETIRDRAFT_220901, partial [Heterobasidion irregulare TC 32-1]